MPTGASAAMTTWARLRTNQSSVVTGVPMFGRVLDLDGQRGLPSFLSMVRILVAAVLFAGAGALAVTSSSTWPLLLVRVVLIALGIALVILALRRRRQKAR